MDQIPAHSTAKRRNVHGRPALWRQPQNFWRTGNYEVCYRCGESTLYQHYCKALQRQCFACGNNGHFAKFCRVTKSRIPARSNEMLQNQMPANKKQKSKRKQERDYKRLLSFRERKSVCSIMPFYELDSKEIIKFIPKIVCPKDKIKQKEIKKENNLLQDQVKMLKHEINSLQQRLQSAYVISHSLATVLAQTRDELKSVQSQNESKTTTDNEIRQQMEWIEHENKFLYSELRKLQQQQQQQKQQMEVKPKLSGSVPTSREAQVQAGNEYKHNLLKQEMIQMTNWYCALEPSNLKQSSQFVNPCSNCGSKYSHDQKYCPAIGNRCCLCIKLGHFTLFCPTKKLF